MADQNPTRRLRLVTLKMFPTHRRFLAKTLDDCREGLVFDLRCYRRLLPDPAQAEREAAIYGRLVKALRCGGSVVPDDEVRRMVRELAETIDACNEYERVVSEAEAFSHLIGLLGEEAGQC